MGLGGDLQLDDAVLPTPSNIVHAGIHGRQQLWRIETPKGLLRDWQNSPNQHRRRSHPLVPLDGDGLQPKNRLEGALSRVR
jgi:hypothetical protein